MSLLMGQAVHVRHMHVMCVSACVRINYVDLGVNVCVWMRERAREGGFGNIFNFHQGLLIPLNLIEYISVRR